MAGKRTTDRDEFVGRMLRIRRTELGMTQTQVATALGVTFQQLQKYEQGTNRIPIARVEKAAQLMGVPIGYFFGDYAELKDPGILAALGDRTVVRLLAVLPKLDGRMKAAIVGVAEAMAAQ